MRSHSMSGSDLSQPLFPSSEGSLHGQPKEGFKFETDFVELAAQFAAPGGGGLSPELSAELALEIVLNQIVEQARVATGADGAAIVLRREGEMVCRASNGPTAPALGSRLDTSSGLSSECVKTLCTQRCGDVLTDTRADVEASQRLGVRSVVVMPLLHWGELLGFFELFSSRPFAFGDGDERTLEALATCTLANLDRASQPLPPAEISSASANAEISADGTNNVAARQADFVILILAAAVVLCAVLLGVLIGRHLLLQKATVGTHAEVPSSTVVRTTGAGSARRSANPANKVEGTGEFERPWVLAKPGGNPSVPPGSLLVFENGKEIFRLLPTQGAPTEASANYEGGMQRTSSLQPEKNEQPDVAEPAPAAENGLLYRVEPEYPEGARQQRIQGRVVLDVYISPEGAVDDVHLVSGPPQLAQAALAAVKQWRFKPRRQDGQVVPMQTRITLNFELPQ
jgi:TonB family protein